MTVRPSTVARSEEGPALVSVNVSREVWRRIKMAAAEQETTVRELVERAVLKELDGKPSKR